MPSKTPSPPEPNHLTTWAVAAVVAVAGIFAALGLRIAPENEPEEMAKARRRIESYAALKEADRLKLESYAWIDRTNGIVQIPVSRAMELVGQELKQSQPRAAYPVASPPP